MIPPKDQLVICFAHAAYQMKACFDVLNTGIASFEVRERDEFERRAPEADVIVVSGMWHNGLIPLATRLRFIQSIGSGTDQFDKAALAARGVRLASAAGVNARAVAEHAMSLILALARRLPEARDNQARHVWRGMIGDLTQREDELTGKTVLIIGLGRIGGRLAQLAKAFDMTVVGFRRDPAVGAGAADSVHGLAELPALLPRADFVVLTCPLVPETRGVIDANALALLRPSAFVVNAARGGCVVESALIEALRAGRIAGAALDVTDPEPAEEFSPLWTLPNVFITPHTGGETRKCEANVNDILVENLERMWRGETALRNQVV
ncbi:MAG TPA: D-2-hydroxyacid dehydrogenase [Acetobacteraceae bacterium]|jgi:phosphoglycerate dehydrogenase-like enzyme|nr:D-2-hydroxyacid dehydrogenase [Acetobacteraceae bacterium]